MRRNGKYYHECKRYRRMNFNISTNIRRGTEVTSTQDGKRTDNIQERKSKENDGRNRSRRNV